MPELPEVETVCRQLGVSAVPLKITKVDILDPRVVKGVAIEELVRGLKGKTIQSVARRGKLIIFELSSRGYLVLHLRISGWIVQDDTVDHHARLCLHGAGGEMIQFCDSRVLGEVRLVRTLEEVSLIRRMGPEPLEVSAKEFMNIFQARSGKIKPLLMDQSLLAGIGNIYAQESLFCAGIHPERRADSLSQEELRKLRRCLRSILTQAIKKGGTTARTYRQTDGSGGEYGGHLCVYQRHRQRCRRCEGKIVKTAVGGRGTCFCPGCQR